MQKHDTTLDSDGFATTVSLPTALSGLSVESDVGSETVQSCLADAVAIMHEELPAQIRSWISSRWGIADATIDELTIGYIDSETDLVNMLRRRGYGDATILQTGLASSPIVDHAYTCNTIDPANTAILDSFLPSDDWVTASLADGEYGHTSRAADSATTAGTAQSATTDRDVNRQIAGHPFAGADVHPLRVPDMPQERAVESDGVAVVGGAVYRQLLTNRGTTTIVEKARDRTPLQTWPALVFAAALANPGSREIVTDIFCDSRAINRVKQDAETDASTVIRESACAVFGVDADTRPESASAEAVMQQFVADVWDLLYPPAVTDDASERTQSPTDDSTEQIIPQTPAAIPDENVAGAAKTLFEAGLVDESGCSHDWTTIPEIADMIVVARELEFVTAETLSVQQVVDLVTDLPEPATMRDDELPYLSNWWDDRIVFPYRDSDGLIRYTIGRATVSTTDRVYDTGLRDADTALATGREVGVDSLPGVSGEIAERFFIAPVAEPLYETVTAEQLTEDGAIRETVAELICAADGPLMSSDGRWLLARALGLIHTSLLTPGNVNGESGAEAPKAGSLRKQLSHPLVVAVPQLVADLVEASSSLPDTTTAVFGWLGDAQPDFLLAVLATVTASAIDTWNLLTDGQLPQPNGEQASETGRDEYTRLTAETAIDPTSLLTFYTEQRTQEDTQTDVEVDPTEAIKQTAALCRAAIGADVPADTPIDIPTTDDGLHDVAITPGGVTTSSDVDVDAADPRTPISIVNTVDTPVTVTATPPQPTITAVDPSWSKTNDTEQTQFSHNGQHVPTTITIEPDSVESAPQPPVQQSQVQADGVAGYYTHISGSELVTVGESETEIETLPIADTTATLTAHTEQSEGEMGNDTQAPDNPSQNAMTPPEIDVSSAEATTTYLHVTPATTPGDQAAAQLHDQDATTESGRAAVVSHSPDSSPTRAVGAEAWLADDPTVTRDRAKYIKQTIHREWIDESAVYEPIYGSNTVSAGDAVIITEGITDAIMAHQHNVPAISPVTTTFKTEHIDAVASLISENDIATAFLLFDNERSGEGLTGALRTAGALRDRDHDAEIRIARLPRPDEWTKIDVAAFLNGVQTADRAVLDALDQERLLPVEDICKTDSDSDATPDTATQSATTATNAESGRPNTTDSNARSATSSTRSDKPITTIESAPRKALLAVLQDSAPVTHHPQYDASIHGSGATGDSLTPGEHTTDQNSASPLAVLVGGQTELTDDIVRDALNAIPAGGPATGWDRWLRLAYAVHSWNSTSRGKRLFTQWSKQAGSDFDQNAQYQIDYIWSGRASSGGREASVGTIIYEAQQEGWEFPSYEVPSTPTGQAISWIAQTVTHDVSPWQNSDGKIPYTVVNGISLLVGARDELPDYDSGERLATHVYNGIILGLELVTDVDLNRQLKTPYPGPQIAELYNVALSVAHLLTCHECHTRLRELVTGESPATEISAALNTEFSLSDCAGGHDRATPLPVAPAAHTLSPAEAHTAWTRLRETAFADTESESQTVLNVDGLESVDKIVVGVDAPRVEYRPLPQLTEQISSTDSTLSLAHIPLPDAALRSVIEQNDLFPNAESLDSVPPTVIERGYKHVKQDADEHTTVIRLLDSFDY